LRLDLDESGPLTDMAMLCGWRSTSLEAAGHDPMPEYERALRSYEHGAALDPDYLFVWSNLTDLNAAIAPYQDPHGIDPSAALDRADRAAARGLAIDPRFSWILHCIALV